MKNLQAQKMKHSDCRVVRDWSEDHDLLLAALATKYGFNNFRAIVRHPVWMYITAEQEELDDIDFEPSSSGTSIWDLIDFFSGSHFANWAQSKPSRSDGLQGLSKLLLGMEISQRALAISLSNSTDQEAISNHRMTKMTEMIH